MIDQVLRLAADVASHADAVYKTDDTVSLLFQGARLVQARSARESGVSVGVVVDGRRGGAGSTVLDAGAVVDAAVAAAALGDDTAVHAPAPSPLPAVRTVDRDASVAPLDELEVFGALVGDLIGERAEQVEVTLERSVGRIVVGNTRGVDAAYDVSGVAIEAAVAPTGSSIGLPCRSWWSGTGLPDEAQLERLAAEVTERLAWAEQQATVEPGPTRVCLTPRALASFLLPVRHALRGKSMLYRSSPLSRSIDEPRFDESFTLVDDPLLDDCCGSRPIDDEGVVCRPITLIEHGVVRGGIYDLETAALAGVPATGHARRTTFGKAQAAYSNLVLVPGALDREELLTSVDDGLLIDSFAMGGSRLSAGGTFRAPVPLAYRVRNGNVAGRVGPFRASGNVFDLLQRIRGVGGTAEWVGSMLLPAMVLDGMMVES